MNFIDLFSGAGGLSEGFISNGFHPVAHIEMMADACYTLKTRIAYHYLVENNRLAEYQQYLKNEISRDELYALIPNVLLDTVHNSKLSKKNLSENFDRIDAYLDQLTVERGEEQRVDIIIGGPPCQAYSIIGRHQIDWENDERLNLFSIYGRFLNKYRPKVFVFENVPGILSAKNGEYFDQIRIFFDRIGYFMDYKILNSSNFGVLQARRRVIIIGWRKDVEFHYPEFENVENNFTVADILRDLPELIAGQSITKGEYTETANQYLQSTGLRKTNMDFFVQHISRPHNENDLKIYRLARDKWVNENQRLRYNDIPSELRTQSNLKSFLDRFKVVNPFGCSHTVVAHIAKDGHYYIHPYQNRSISVREAARVQSFPDDYFFEGSRTTIFTQIGNAVPPLMAEKIANKIHELIWH